MKYFFNNKEIKLEDSIGFGDDGAAFLIEINSRKYVAKVYYESYLQNFGKENHIIINRLAKSEKKEHFDVWLMPCGIIKDENGNFVGYLSEYFLIEENKMDNYLELLFIKVGNLILCLRKLLIEAKRIGNESVEIRDLTNLTNILVNEIIKIIDFSDYRINKNISEAITINLNAVGDLIPQIMFDRYPFEFYLKEMEDFEESGYDNYLTYLITNLGTSKNLYDYISTKYIYPMLNQELKEFCEILEDSASNEVALRLSSLIAEELVA